MPPFMETYRNSCWSLKPLHSNFSAMCAGLSRFLRPCCAAAASRPQAAPAGCAVATLQRPAFHGQPRRHPAVKAGRHVEDVEVSRLRQLRTGRR